MSNWKKHTCYDHMWEFMPSEGICMIRCSRCREEKNIDSKIDIKPVTAGNRRQRYNSLFNNGKLI